MLEWRKHLEAIGTALLLIEKLPSEAVWALECTNDDDAESPSVLNVFAPESEWIKLRDALRLGKPTDFEDSFQSYRLGTLLVSFIEPEESNV